MVKVEAYSLFLKCRPMRRPRHLRGLGLGLGFTGSFSCGYIGSVRKVQDRASGGKKKGRKRGRNVHPNRNRAKVHVPPFHFGYS